MKTSEGRPWKRGEAYSQWLKTRQNIRQQYPDQPKQEHRGSVYSFYISRSIGILTFCVISYIVQFVLTRVAFP